MGLWSSEPISYAYLWLAGRLVALAGLLGYPMSLESQGLVVCLSVCQLVRSVEQQQLVFLLTA